MSRGTHNTMTMTTGTKAVTRDRNQARLTKRVMIAWTVIWMAIIGVLFVFGEHLTTLVA